MELKGKKVLFLGDSITEGIGCTEPIYFYWNQFAEKTGAVVKGYGVSGARYAKQMHPRPEPADREFDLTTFFRNRLPQMDNDADAVVVFGGTNDFAHGDVPLGRFSDRCDTSFYGELHLFFTALITKYPGAQLVVMTPTHRENEWIVGINEYGIRQDFPLIAYVNAIREVAEFYSVPVLDLYRDGGIQPIVPIQKEMFMPDGLHPGNAGAGKIADKLAGFFKTL